VYNPNKSLISVDLGPVVTPIGNGNHLFSLSISNVIRKIDKSGTQARHYGSSLFTDLFYSTPESVTIEQPGSNSLSFSLKPLEKTDYLKIPYYIYLLLPLILIVIFVNVYSRAVLTALFYYPLLFLLFDFRFLFFRLPFSSILNESMLSRFSSYETLIAVAIGIFFTVLAVYGSFGWKERRDKFIETLIVLFFLNLPLILRF
jgi:hypothetical protein